MRRALLLALLVASPLLAGCLGEDSSPVEVTPFYELNAASPGRLTSFVFHLRSTNPFKQTLPVTGSLPEGWAFEPERNETTMLGRANDTLVVGVRVDANASYRLYELDVFVGDTRARVRVDVRPLLDEGWTPGRAARAYLTEFGNGTRVATNDPALLREAIAAPPPNGSVPALARLRLAGPDGGAELPDALDALLRSLPGGARPGETLAARGAEAGHLVRVVAIEPDAGTA